MTQECQGPAASYDYVAVKVNVSNDLVVRRGYTARVTVMGDRIRKTREGRGWSLEDLARESGMDRVTLNRIELGKQRPHKSTLKNIERALNSPRPTEVFHGESAAGETGDRSRIEDRLADLFVYIKSLDEQTRANFIRGLVALLTAIEHPSHSASTGTTENDGR